MTLALAAPDDTVLVDNYVADTLLLAVVLPVASDTVRADGVAVPPPNIMVVQAATDTVLVDGVVAATPTAIVLPVVTDTVVAAFDFAPVASGGDASSAAVAALEGNVAALQQGVAAVQTSLGSLTGLLDGSLADVQAQIEAASSSAIAQAEAASALATAAVQATIEANQAADAQAQAASAAALADVQSAVATSQTAVTAAQASASSALAQLAAIATTITSMQSAIGANASSITVQAAALTTLNQSLSGQITAIQTAFDANKSSVTASLGTLTTAQSALSTAQTNLASTVAGNAAAASQGLTTEVTAREALADSVTSFRASYDQSVSFSNASISTLTSQGNATAASLSTLQSTVAGNTSAITNNATTAANATQTVAGNLATLTASYNQSYSSFTSSIATLSSAQSTMATAVTSLQSAVAGNTATIGSNATTAANATSTVAANLSTLTSAYNQSYSSFTSSISTLNTQVSANAASLSTLSSSLGTTNATVTQNAATAASATQAVAGTVSSFQTTYNQQIASYNSAISLLQSAQQSTATQVSTLSANAAGAVGGGNMLANSELNGSDGWANSSYPAGSQFGLNLAGYYSPWGINVLWSHIPGTPVAGAVADWSSPYPYIPAQGGVRYEASVAAAYHRASYAALFVLCIDANGTGIQYVGGWTGGRSGGAANGDLANFDRIGGFFTAPPGTCFFDILMRVTADGTEADPYGFFTKPFIRPASPGQTALSPYSPGTQANVPAINATISSNATAAANATGAVATNLNSVATTVNGHTLTLQQYGTSINGILDRYFLGFQADGQTGGLTLTGAIQPDGTLNTNLSIKANVQIYGSLLVAGGSYGSIGAGTATNLTQDLTIYVRTDGNDANAGLTNSAAGAFKTLQAAWNAVKKRFVLGGFRLIFQLGMPGTYAGCNFDAAGPSGSILVTGDVNNQAAYIIQPVTTYANVTPACIRSEVTGVQITGCKLDTTPVGADGSNAPVFGTWAAGTTAQIVVGPDVTIGRTNSNTSCVFIYSNYGGVTLTKGDILLDGGDGGAGISSAIGADYAGIYAGNSGDHTTITCRNLYWNFGGAVTSQGTVLFLSTSFAVQGGVNGVAFFAGLNGVINTYTGGNPNFIPNSIAGGTYNGGQYV